EVHEKKTKRLVERLLGVAEKLIGMVILPRWRLYRCRPIFRAPFGGYTIGADGCTAVRILTDSKLGVISIGDLPHWNSIGVPTS
ncbi:hypothetical protein BHE74_00044917, partial [Ensete ventricosum]